MVKYLPNILTIIRFLLVPIAVVFALYDNYILAITVIAIASLTDILDGYIARKYNCITDFGKLMDPLADKFMQIAMLVALVIKDAIPSWILVIFVIKDLILVSGSVFLYKKDFVVYSCWYGRLATVLIYLAVIFSMTIKQFGLDSFYMMNQYIYYVATALTIFSCVMYIRRNLFKIF